jgi:hypothetical protein
MNGKVARALLAALVALLASFGCGCVPLGAPYDAQACAENALRRNPDPAILLAAAGELSTWCRTGDAGSCSALADLIERGAARGAPEKASALRLAACALGDEGASARVEVRGGLRVAGAGARP